MREILTRILLPTVLSATACMPVAMAQSPTVTCNNAQFSAAVVSRFPRVREACLDIITRDAQYYAVFRAKLLGVSPTSVRIRPKLPDGSLADARKVSVSADRRVLVDGRSESFSELALGQELTVYIEVREPMVVFPPAVATDPWQPVPLEVIPPSPSPARMPATAGLVGWLGILSAGLLSFAAVCQLRSRW